LDARTHALHHTPPPSASLDERGVAWTHPRTSTTRTPSTTLRLLTSAGGSFGRTHPLHPLCLSQRARGGRLDPRTPTIPSASLNERGGFVWTHPRPLPPPLSTSAGDTHPRPPTFASLNERGGFVWTHAHYLRLSTSGGDIHPRPPTSASLNERGGFMWTHPRPLPSACRHERRGLLSWVHALSSNPPALQMSAEGHIIYLLLCILLRTRPYVVSPNK
jgi:hypothetical protein